MKNIKILLLLLSSVVNLYAVDLLIPLQKANIDTSDYPSLQRGAKYFVNYCSGCHSLSYTRYDRLARGVGIKDYQGIVYESLVQDNLMFNTKKLASPVLRSMTEADSAKWFGVSPPDLTLVTRYRSADWVYTYLKSFYIDKKRPLGVNNLVFKDTAMPHVLANLQGEQLPQYSEVEKITAGKPVEITKVFRQFTQVKAGSFTPKEYDVLVLDLVNFLQYIGEPEKAERIKIGVWVILFLLVFLVVAYLLKREYWKDVH